MTNFERVLAVVAHADDEVLGCGGTLAVHSSKGHDVRVLVIADGVSSRSTGNHDLDQESINERQQHARTAASILGISDVVFCGYPDNQLDTVPMLEIVKTIESFLNVFPANTVYTHHSGDLNVDHRITSQAVITATRPVPNSSVKSLFSFEVPSSTEWQFAKVAESFNPNYYVDISETLHRKISALSAYKYEVKGPPHPRSSDVCDHLARWRGSNVGLVAAEAFTLLRGVHVCP